MQSKIIKFSMFTIGFCFFSHNTWN